MSFSNNSRKFERFLGISFKEKFSKENTLKKLPETEHPIDFNPEDYDVIGYIKYDFENKTTTHIPVDQRPAD